MKVVHGELAENVSRWLHAACIRQSWVSEICDFMIG